MRGGGRTSAGDLIFSPQLLHNTTLTIFIHFLNLFLAFLNSSSYAFAKSQALLTLFLAFFLNLCLNKYISTFLNIIIFIQIDNYVLQVTGGYTMPQSDQQIILQESLHNLNFSNEFDDLTPEEIATQLINHPKKRILFFGTSNAVFFSSTFFTTCPQPAVHALLSILIALAQKNIALEKEIAEEKDELADYVLKGFPL
jgi:hypothetical protein